MIAIAFPFVDSELAISCDLQFCLILWGLVTLDPLGFFFHGSVLELGTSEPWPSVNDTYEGYVSCRCIIAETMLKVV